MVATTDVPLVPLLDDVLGNAGADIGRMTLEDLVALIVAQITPQLEALEARIEALEG